eukprot:3392683-Pleurochrysis_carterae.AAC.5
MAYILTLDLQRASTSIVERFEHRSALEDTLSTLGLPILIANRYGCLMRFLAHFPKSKAPIV